MDGHNDFKEKMAFVEFKRRMKGDLEAEMYEDDRLFHRFLKARDYEVDHSEAMLRKHLEWRKRYNIKNILQWKVPEVVQKHFLLSYIGQDKEGCLLKYNHFSNTDFRGIFESITLDEWQKSLVHFFEGDILEMKKLTEQGIKPSYKVVYIENCENFTLSKATDRKVIFNLASSIHLYLDNYPETLRSVYIINAPSYFNIFFAVLKTLLPSTVVKKIRVYSDDSWKNDLLEAVDAEVLPAFLGGKREDPDGNPFCPSVIPTSDLVPHTYYFKYNKRTFPSVPDAENIKISRQSIHEVFLEVKEPGSNLEWEFELKSGDIIFGLYHKDKRGNKIELLQSHKISTDQRTEIGLYKCDNIGTYIVIFDNSYSHLKSKEMCYKITITNSQELFSDVAN